MVEIRLNLNEAKHGYLLIEWVLWLNKLADCGALNAKLTIFAATYIDVIHVLQDIT